MTTDDLIEILSDLPDAQWRAVLAELASRRCIACGSDCSCECSEEVDKAKALVTRVPSLSGSEDT